MRPVAALSALALAGALAVGASAQAPGYAPRTGDRAIDAELVAINDYGLREPQALVDEVVRGFGAPRYLLKELLETRHWPPGDAYYACALAYQAHRPCSDALSALEQRKGRDWVGVAVAFGIKPGSAGFAALKAQLEASHAHHQAPEPVVPAPEPAKQP
ncbi:MAG: hypothetical protein ABI588_03345 [Arenimonas sp.]